MRAAVFDTETTGLPLPSVAAVSSQPKIIEIGLVIVEGGRVVEELSVLVNPGEPLTDEIVKITGLTDLDLATAESFGSVRGEFERTIAECEVLIAHNAEFDVNMLRFEYERLGATLWLPEVICTACEFSHLFGRYPRMVELYKHILGKELAQTHRALDDARALAEIVIATRLA